MFVVVVVAGGAAVVEQVGGAVGFTGVDQGTGQGVVDDLAFDSDPAESFGVRTQAAEQVDRGGGAPSDEVGQCLSDRCEDLRVVGAGRRLRTRVGRGSTQTTWGGLGPASRSRSRAHNTV